jgi:hypothetical protein
MRLWWSPHVSSPPRTRGIPAQPAPRCGPLCPLSPPPPAGARSVDSTRRVTPLHVATYHHQQQLMHLLLDKGVDVSGAPRRAAPWGGGRRQGRGAGGGDGSRLAGSLAG